MRKPKQLPNPEPTIKVDIYTLGIEYDEHTNCEANGCDCICRCGRISNARVVGFDGEPITISGTPTDVVTEYCIGRLLVLHGTYKVENYEPIVVSGYYGEEIGPISFTNAIQLQTDLCKLVKLSPIEMVKYVLQLEYSYIPPHIEELTSVEVVSVDLSDIVINGLQKRFTDNITVDPTKPSGVLRKIDSTKYALVDGYSRFSILHQSKVNKAKYLLIG